LQKSKNVIPEVLNRESSSFKNKDPRLRPSRAGFWIPAFAGMTDFRHKNILLQEPLCFWDYRNIKKVLKSNIDQPVWSNKIILYIYLFY